MENQYIHKLIDNAEKIEIGIDNVTGELISVSRELIDTNKNKKLIDWKTKKKKNQAVYSSFKRLKNLKKHRLNISASQLENIKSCGSVLDFKILTDGSKKLKNAYFCRNRFCPICIWRKSLRVAYDNNSILSEFLNRNEENRLLFLTLTIQNCDFNKLKDTIKKLNNSLRNLRRTKEYKNAVMGEIKVVEITVNLKSQTFHPHLHLILATDEDYFKSERYVPHERWAELWKRSLKSDKYVFANIQAISKNKSNEKNAAIAEISKYAVKDTDFLIYKKDEKERIIVDQEKTDLILFYLYTQTKGLRFISYTGIFRKIKADLKIKNEEDMTSKDLIEAENKAEIDEASNIIVRYVYNYGYSTYLYNSYYVESEEDSN